MYHGQLVRITENAHQSLVLRSVECRRPGIRLPDPTTPFQHGTPLDGCRRRALASRAPAPTSQTYATVHPARQRHEAPEITQKFAQVSNPSRDKIFEDFRTNIHATKFAQAITKAGPPPTIQRKGEEVQMCASYHLRGSCRNLCTRVADHTRHSAEEDQQLYNWCKKASG
jgi:hypothetical protein